MYASTIPHVIILEMDTSLVNDISNAEFIEMSGYNFKYLNNGN